MTDVILITVFSIWLWASLGLIGLIIGVLRFDLDGSHRSCFWAVIFGPIVLIAVIDAIIRGEDV